MIIPRQDIKFVFELGYEGGRSNQKEAEIIKQNNSHSLKHV